MMTVHERRVRAAWSIACYATCVGAVLLPFVAAPIYFLARGDIYSFLHAVGPIGFAAWAAWTLFLFSRREKKKRERKPHAENNA